MQQFLYWRVLVLLLYGGHPKVIDAVGGWYGAAIEQQVLGACVESFQGHVISLSPHGSHLSSSLRAFIARLMLVPFSSSELDVRATAHFQRCGQTPRRYGVYPTKMLFTAYHGSPRGPSFSGYSRGGRPGGSGPVWAWERPPAPRALD
jgi:hypothetical protein